jgi:DNA helicase-2/ATP-dependent DNA helicase PcrA
VPATTLASPDSLVEDLNEGQREAVLATDGPVAILAGAGTGKTRVISRRTAYAIATDVVPAEQVLVVTFTDKAANEMVDRLRRLGLPGVTARTFHSHALSQLRHFWPSRHDGRQMPQILDSKLPILVPLIRALPGHYRFTAAKDVADEIEWAKNRRVAPAAYEHAATGRTAPLPADLMARLYGSYERSKGRANRVDFDDMLTLSVDLLEGDDEAAEIVRSRKRWFSVDEYQDTNPLQQRLLELWLGDRRDVCVVGDEDQTIYTFTGATSTFLSGFARRYPGARTVALTDNYRSTPEVLELANRLLAADGRSKRLVATHRSGPRPTIDRHASDEAELAGLSGRVRDHIAAGVPASEIAVLVRTNAQLAPIEEALTRAGLPYQVRGVRFYDRAEVRGARDVLRGARLEEEGPRLRGTVEALWVRELGYEPGEPTVDEGRERTAALDTLLAILDGLVRGDPGLTSDRFLDELEDRRRRERDGATDGVNLLTYHRAKGLEWDVVLLPALEEGSLPVRPSGDDEAIAEERRLLYVGLTRARIHLHLSWAERREVRGKEVNRRRSRFLEALTPVQPRRIVQLPDAVPAPTWSRDAATDPVSVALREWRTARSRADAVPAYVVAHDETLGLIAEARPRSVAELRRIKGMGPAKLEKYGAEILAVVGLALEAAPS